MKKHFNELSDEQINRQDFVDNAIFTLINKLNPSSGDIEWNIEMIGEIRGCLKEWIVDRFNLCDEQSFYHYVKE